MKEYRRALARIDLDAIRGNIESLMANTKPGTRFINVIKADGYGHGALEIAKHMADYERLWGFAVASFDEALSLRNGGITQPILILGCTFPEQFAEAINQDLSLTMYDTLAIDEVVAVARELGKPVKVHIKLDTGMGRLGFPVDATGLSAIANLKEMPEIVLEGVYTHFAAADETDKSFTGEQLKKYNYGIAELKKMGVTFANHHTANSAGIIDHQEANFDLVRSGIAAYGLYPSKDVRQQAVPLKPAMEITSHLASVKLLPAGSPISYGRTHTTTRETKVGVVPFGYADGYPRSLSGKGYVLIKGQKAPILGRVCMDMFMVDVSDIPDVSLYDKVTIVGYNGRGCLSVDTLSELSGRFNYEFVCDISKRVPREYIAQGKVISQRSYF
ncbi:alanine racemase [Ohessyouella blattaphilus]|uniref:Alanine racemase n=1 Tax=Ohessyouella blattaphilus TaxID=2949333 RepID=A0ABT1EEP8_9FIRM|nr:alanine racemase [Ohessyouella blattaphilus]MCP1109181.1 alanine racemase [Ohessyouella blattaphilus]MCR8562575.1 alanine racemase [Ohessyouella blattaphilus]MDL2250555.1 alanine racemase [Lachnospiraceae bacterium OttesenSCG-928-J05]